MHHADPSGWHDVLMQHWQVTCEGCSHASGRPGHDALKHYAVLEGFKIHMMTQRGEEPHHCSDCGKQFRDAGSLNTTMMFYM